MPTSDAIRDALQAPMDWEVFERLAYEILLQDDMPSLQRLGGSGDFGIDAEELAYYQNVTVRDVVVQVSSQQTQVDKVRDTLKTLAKANVEFNRLVMVFRQPVSSAVRMAIQQHGQDEGVAIDVRDEGYLLGQLGNLSNGLFARYFLGAKEQLDSLFSEGDPLKYTHGSMRGAVLASIASYVVHPSARLVRGTLFDRTVLAVVSEAGGSITAPDIAARLLELTPNTAGDLAQIDASIQRLTGRGLCTVTGDRVEITPSAQSALVEAFTQIRVSLDSLRDSIAEGVRARHKLNDADLGRIERNVRRGLLLLLRSVGPTTHLVEDAASQIAQTRSQLERVLGKDLQPAKALTLVASFSRYVQDPSNASSLAILARSYAGLFLWNLDPVGRRWQKTAMSRGAMVLDTDAILTLLLPDLPFHAAVKTALLALVEDGIQVSVPREMLREAAEHLGRADRTYARWGNSLERWSPELAEDRIWHALVRGYYYHRLGGGKLEFRTYWAQYYDAVRPFERVRFLLNQHVPFTLVDEFELDERDRDTYDALHEGVLEQKERQKRKAQFRDDEMMKARVATDVTVALSLARISQEAGQQRPTGYVVTEDRTFSYMQAHAAWGERPRIRLATRAVPSLAEFVCGVRIKDDELVRLLFSPILAAAAGSVASDLETLAAVGVDFRHRDVYSVEWELRESLHERVLEHDAIVSTEGVSAEGRIQASISLGVRARESGLSLETAYNEIVDHYRAAVAKAEKSQAERDRLREVARRLIEAAGVVTKKGRRRINRVLADLGGIEAALEEEGEEQE